MKKKWKFLNKLCTTISPNEKFSERESINNYINIDYDIIIKIVICNNFEKYVTRMIQNKFNFDSSNSSINELSDESNSGIQKNS